MVQLLLQISGKAIHGPEEMNLYYLHGYSSQCCHPVEYSCRIQQDEHTIRHTSFPFRTCCTHKGEMLTDLCSMRNLNHLFLIIRWFLSALFIQKPSALYESGIDCGMQCGKSRQEIPSHMDVYITNIVVFIRRQDYSDFGL